MIRAARLAALTLAALLALAARPAAAQVYKCTDGEQVTYSEAPCEHGAQTVLQVPASPAATPEPGALKRLQQESAALQKQRQAREAQQDRADASRAREAARRRDACAKLELARKWADDDVRRASHQGADAARLKAQRAAERHAAACA